MKNKKKIIISIITLVVILSTIFIVNYLSEYVEISLKGNDTIKVKVFDTYEDNGAEAKLCHFKNCKDITSDLKTNSNVDTKILGDYSVEYEIVHANKTYTKARKITVVDETKPEITLTAGNKVVVCPAKKYVEDGYTATDNYDGDITKNVEVETSTSKSIYKVSDSSGNKTEITRTIEYKDETKPVIKLNGSSSITVTTNTTYTEKGATSTDNCDTLNNDNIKITSNVNTKKEGTYNVKYSISDNAGNTATANRTVKVKTPVSFNTTDKKEFQTNLEKYIKEKNYNVSIGYVNLETGYQYLYNPGTVYYGASLVKTVDALYIYEKTTFDETTRKNVEKAISVSDNAAHNKLVNKIGIENLRSYGRSLGAKNFLTRSNSDYFGNTTVYDQIAIWKHVKKVVDTNPKGKEFQKYFINDYFSFMQFDGIPKTMHKYGWYGSYYHDVGIVYSDSPYIVVILTKHGNGNFKTITKDLSQKIYELNKIDD